MIAATAAAGLFAFGGGINHASADTVQQATGAVQQTYTVQAGDTLSGIAAKFNTTIDQLQQLNQLPNINLLTVGQQLKINGQAVQTAHQTATQTVTKWVPKTIYHTVNVPVQSGANQSANNSRQAAVAQSTPAVNNNVAANNSNAGSNNTGNGNTGLSSSEQAAKNWIVQRESGGNYNARNGQYIGKYQLSSSYLHGDYSPANQDRVANQYVAQRYGNWGNAAAHERAYGWY